MFWSWAWSGVHSDIKQIVMFELILYIPFNNFSIMLGWSHCFLGPSKGVAILSAFLPQGHNMELYRILK